MVDGLAIALDRLAPKPTLIFGHSMGAMIGYELAARLVGEASPHAPRTLIVSGRTAPGSSSTLGDLLGLDDAGFADALAARYDGIPAALLADRELMAVFLPTLRADFRMVAEYRPDPAACPRLPCPILALGGADDIHAAPERLTAWQDFTTAGFMREIFPGGHFYLAADPARVVARVLAARGMV